jgi:DNA invertase Pin-like site-specific DNA recombinase
VSLGTQEAKGEAYGLVKDGTLLKVIRDEGYRAKHLADLDKLIKRFERHHVARVSLQESLDATTATGRLMMKLLASVSHWEREVIGERTSNALPHLKAQGKRYGHTVYNNPEGIALMHQ